MSTNKKIMSEEDIKNTITEDKNTAVEIAGTKKTAPSENRKQIFKTQYEGITSFVYVGPSLPSGRLKSFSVLSGTYEQITEYYKEAIEIYPGIVRLIVPISHLAESRQKTQTSGNLMHNQYQEIVSTIKTRGDVK